MKFKFGWDRYIIANCNAKYFTAEIQWRSQKSNLSNIYKRNLILFEKNILEKIVYDDNKVIKNYVNLDEIQDIYNKYESGNNRKFI